MILIFDRSLKTNSILYIKKIKKYLEKSNLLTKIFIFLSLFWLYNFDFDEKYIFVIIIKSNHKEFISILKRY